MNFYKYLENKAKQENVIKLVVGAVILNKQGDIFIAKRKEDDFMGGLFEIPGGHLETGETIYDALGREVKEETNLILDKVIFYINHFDYLNDNNQKCRQFNFAIQVENLTNILLTEHSNYKWLKLQDIENFNNISKEVKDSLIIYKFNMLNLK